MQQKSLAKIMLLGVLFLSPVATFASDNKAETKTENKSDLTTSLNVKLALLNKLGTDSLHVEVVTDMGALHLKGVVNKRETRELAETIAKSVTGVKSVKNDILLKASEANSNKTGVAAGEAEMEVKDAVLSTQVRIALVDQMGTDGFRIGTEAASGVITLRFDRDFIKARRAEASKIVDAVEGVTKVITVEKT